MILNLCYFRIIYRPAIIVISHDISKGMIVRGSLLPVLASFSSYGDGGVASVVGCEKVSS